VLLSDGGGFLEASDLAFATFRSPGIRFPLTLLVDPMSASCVTFSFPPSSLSLFINSCSSNSPFSFIARLTFTSLGLGSTSTNAVRTFDSGRSGVLCSEAADLPRSSRELAFSNMARSDFTPPELERSKVMMGNR
jgi:hypothetical protein